MVEERQGVMSTYKGRALGTTVIRPSQLHETKNYTAGGEGGATLINEDKALIERAEIIREKGTNRPVLPWSGR